MLQQRLQKLKAQLAGAKQQNDDPEEAPRLEAEIKSVESELAKLKAS